MASFQWAVVGAHSGLLGDTGILDFRLPIVVACPCASVREQGFPCWEDGV
jgi:hypothetical protein